MTNRVRGGSLQQNKMHGRMACLTQRLQHLLGEPPAAVRRNRSTSRWSAPGLPACIFCIGCARPASRQCCWRRPATSAAPGTGTDIPAHAVTFRPSTTAIPSTRSWSARGNGRRNTRPNRKSCATSASSPTAMSCGATSALAPRSRRRIGIRPANAGCSRPTMARQSPAAFTSWPPAVSPRQSRRRSTASRISRARSISPAAGRIRRSSSPASASRSSARDHRGSSRSR